MDPDPGSALPEKRLIKILDPPCLKKMEPDPESALPKKRWIRILDPPCLKKMDPDPGHEHFFKIY